MTQRETPEERELSRKQSELAEFEVELAQRELDLATLQAELRAFEARYIRIVGVLYAELDDIEAQIVEAQILLNPNNSKIQEQAEKARTKAQESTQATGIAQEPRQEKFNPSEKLNKLYREVAKHIHPDLAIDEKERARREQLMADANLAYEEGDEDRLLEILEQWESSPESVEGGGTGAELVRVIRKIAQVKVRLQAIAAEMPELEKTDLWQLKGKVEEAGKNERNILSEMAAEVESQIAEAKQRLNSLNIHIGERA
jgi:hypothetical protein